MLDATLKVEEGDATVEEKIRRTGQLAAPLDVEYYTGATGNPHNKT